ncbi:MAG TPA: putative metal-binding motif-containing protein [Polyangiaceae bacterium]|nr:putative metal-binding motif-containing protein [Polyangiaceae bacterium]
MDAGSDAGAAGASYSEGGLNVGPDAGDPTLGGPCADDGQCVDALDCTSDTCDVALQRCRHTPDDSKCDNGVYCDGAEVCDPKLGCGAGAPVSCADSDPCTIDTCVEKTHSCSRAPRDADGDGDPVWNCPGGGDCDDTDPTVSSKAKEICGNGKDDNCNGKIDEPGCIAPAYDTCADPLLIDKSGSFSLSLAATKLDYPTTCAPADQNLHDVVVAISVPPGDPQDVDVVAQSAGSVVSLGSAGSCGKAANVSCAPSVTTKNETLSRYHFYALAPGNYPLYIAGDGEGEVSLSVQFSAASAPPSNETCGTAAALVAGVSQTVSLVGAALDLSSACMSQAGDLVYSFTLDTAQDVHVFANPLDDYGTPQLSLRNAQCSKAADELTCRSGAPAALFARALPAGTYFVSVGDSGPGDVDLRLEVSAPSAPLPDEGCAQAPALSSGESIDLALADHADAVNTGCLSGAVDSSHSLLLAESSDVLLVERISTHDTGAVSLATPACTADSRLSCGTSDNSPVRARAYAVPAGSYRAVAESALGDPVSLTAFTRKAVPATLVALADDCSAPFEMPVIGGRFQGNTANAHADYSAGCDVGNQAPGGAPDQMLHLALKRKSRVIFDMAGSSYATMLSVRSGATCPGTELSLACAAGYQPERSYLDLDLDPGDYYVQVDGYAGAFGAWSLDVYVTPDAI